MAAVGEAMYQRRRNDTAELPRDITIEALNHEHDLDIDADTCETLCNGTRMEHALAVEALLHRDGALQLDPTTEHYSAHFPTAPRIELDEETVREQGLQISANRIAPIVGSMAVCHLILIIM